MVLDVIQIMYYIGIVVISVYWKQSMMNGLRPIQHSEELIEYRLFYKKRELALCWLPIFFHKTRVQKSDKEICTLFFSFVPPRIAQEGRL